MAPKGEDVYEWPEFRAFCERLGIAIELPTMAINIHIPFEGLVTITQEYCGQDTQDPEGDGYTTQDDN